MKYYAIYDSETDELLATGTSEQCRRALGFSSRNSFYSVVCRSRKGTNKKYEVTVLQENGYENDYTEEAEWENVKNASEESRSYVKSGNCSVCHRLAFFLTPPRHCPHCGLEMIPYVS